MRGVSARWVVACSRDSKRTTCPPAAATTNVPAYRWIERTSYYRPIMSSWTTQRGEGTQQHAEASELNLALGQPSPRLLPLEAIAAAAARRLGPGNDPLVLQYATGLGRPSMRADLAAMLERRHAVAVTGDQLMLTSGNSAALGLLSAVLRGDKSTVFVEDPTYFLAAGILQTHGLEPVPIPVDDDGLCVDEVARRLERDAVHPAFIYTIPTHHNPTGATLSAERRRKLVALARRHQVPIVADEPYNLLSFDKPLVPPLASEPDGEWAISLGSFSKILGPGLRLGWIHAAPGWIERVRDHGEIRSGGATNPVIAHIVHDTITSGFLERHIDMLCATFRERAAALEAALHRHVPHARFRRADGGYFCWLQLPDGVDVDALSEAARAHDLRFTPGHRCGTAPRHRQFVRLSFAFYEAHELEEAACRLEGALTDLREHDGDVGSTRAK